MQHKLMTLLTTFVLISLLIAPASIAQAQVNTQSTAPDCPHVESNLLKDKSFLHSLPPECIKTYKQLTRQVNSTANLLDAQPMAVSAPDSFGYTYDDAVSYSWISATTNSGLTGDDEFKGPINIGFNFPFYGIPQSQLYFSTNGLITFGAGSWNWSGSDIPSDTNPNNLIAPFWDDLRVGSPYNGGAIYYSQGGSSPNRYFVVEWRNVEYWYNSTIISFEAILYENGDIVYQYQSLPDSYWPTVGIEDSVGYDGLQYSAYWSGNPLDAIRFYYPAPAARVLVSPGERAGGFAPIGGHKDFNITISNSGTLGADTYDLTITSGWPVTFYASNGVTPLTDTDADGLIDTGSLPQGTSRTVIGRFSAPGGAKIGDNTTAVMIVKSSLNLSKTKMIVLDVSIPAGFANVFQDNSDGGMSFMTADSEQTSLFKITTDNYFGYFPAIVSLTNGNYLYAWTKYSSNGSNAWTDIEYVVLDRGGNIILPITKLTNNSSTTIYTGDYVPSFAVAPNGTVGVVWYRTLETLTNQVNYNIYFATFSSSGNLLTGPTNITNNTVWGIYNEVPRFFSPTIAASDDNRFILGWEYRRPGPMGGNVNDVWYAVQNSTGVSVFPPTALTIYGWSWQPILNSLTGGKVIMTWGEDVGGPFYAVINSNGTISIPKTSLLGYGPVYYTPDAVQLPNGKVALAWNSREPYSLNSGVEFAILDSSYNLLQDSTFAPTSEVMNECVSVTTDASSRVIMTWAGPNNRLFYALGNDTGAFVTEPMIYKASGDFVDVNCNGEGNAPYTAHSFNDVSSNYWARDFIERLYAAGITGGCGNENYCPEGVVTRAQMAVFLERGIHGSLYNPPAVGGSTDFGDVSPMYWAAAWIKQLAAEGITGGCGSGIYCPEAPVTRAQMAIFLLRSKHGAFYNPPAVGSSTGFGDVNPNYWAAAWIKQLVTEGITAGCGSGNYCPEQPVTRAQMAVFLVRTFNLP